LESLKSSTKDLDRPPMTLRNFIIEIQTSTP
jgi:hypothetical protein